MQIASDESVGLAKPLKTYRRQSPRALFWVVIGVPLLGLVLAFPLVRSSLFMKYADNYGLTAERDLFEKGNQPCDVVVSGDSTSMMGLDPRIIEEETHLSVCNVGATMPMIELLGLAPLDKYLARNPKPRYLLLQFHVENLREVPNPNLKFESVEGFVPLIRYSGPIAAIRVMAKHPDAFIGLMHYAYVTSVHNIRVRSIKNKVPIVSKGLGAYSVMPFQPLQDCPNVEYAPVQPEAAAWIQALRRRYADKADHVVINAAPTSPCNPLYSQWRSSLDGQIDNSMTVYPLGFFVDDYFHLSRNGALRSSAETAEEIDRIQDRSTGKNLPAH
jgi:hypothetical protein